jgi:hypothetical protein
MSQTAYGAFAHHFSGQLKIDENHIINLESLLRVSMSECHGAKVLARLR